MSVVPESISYLLSEILFGFLLRFLTSRNHLTTCYKYYPLTHLNNQTRKETRHRYESNEGGKQIFFTLVAQLPGGLGDIETHFLMQSFY